jgi:molybdopterin molybdotransferase
VRRENALQHDGSVTIAGPTGHGTDIRRAGEDVPRGEVIIAPRTTIRPYHLALLHAAGVTEIVARRCARVTVLSTGSELRVAGTPLGPGAVYDANRPMLASLFSHDATVSDAGIVADDRDVLAEHLARASRTSDVILSSGGTAGSEVDLVAAAIEAAGGIARSHRLALKPGRPIVVGRLGQTTVIGLPGNPLAAFVAAQLVAWPLISAISGGHRPKLRGLPALLSRDAAHVPGRTEYLPARLLDTTGEDDPVVEIEAGRGGGAAIGRFGRAGGLAELRGRDGFTAAGTRVRFFPDGNLMGSR